MRLLCGHSLKITFKQNSVALKKKNNPSNVILMQIYVNLLLGLCASKIFYGQIYVFYLAIEI